jgi:hypothetical protein
VQVVPLDADFELPTMGNEATAKPLGVVVDVPGEALDDGDEIRARIRGLPGST